MASSPYRFQADTQNLRTQCDKRLAAMRAVRTAHEALWLDIRDNFEPDIGIALDEGERSDRAARRRDEKILNTEPRTLLHRLASGLQSGVTNQSQRWFSLIALNKGAMERSAVKVWLSKATDIMSEAMARGNLYTTLDRKYLHMGAFGQGVSVAVKGDNPGEVHHELIDTGDYWLAENRRGRVDTLIRRIPMNADQMLEEFGSGWMPENIRSQAAGTAKQAEHNVFNLVRPNDGRPEFADIPKERAFVSVYWLESSRDHNAGILAVRGYDYNPIVAPRWSVSGSVYGSGCGKAGLGDAVQLQTMERDKLGIISQDATPTVLAPANMRGQTALDSYPGGVVWYPDQSDNGPQPVRRLYETRQSLQSVLEGIHDTERRLGRTFYADLFAMMLNISAQARAMTAREVSELASEKIALLGPILTRLSTDLLDPLVSIYFAILLADGAFPPPPQELTGIPLGVRYSSALHVEQISANKMRGLIKVLDVVGMVAKLKPEALDKFDADQTIDEVLAATPDSAAVILDDDAVEKIRAERAERQAAQERMLAMTQAAPGVGRGVRDLSETKLNNGSALDAVVGAAQQQAGAQQ